MRRKDQSKYLWFRGWTTQIFCYIDSSLVTLLKNKLRWKL